MSDQAILDSREAALAAASTVFTMAKGDAPSNEQLNNTLDSSVNAIEQRRQEAVFNEHGDQLAIDAERALHMAKLFINEKNKDEVFQDLFYQSKGAKLEAQVQALKIGNDLKNQVADDVDEIGEKVDDIYYVAKRVAYEIIRSKQFRGLLLDVIELLQTIFYRKLNSTVDGLTQIKEDGKALGQAAKIDYEKGDTSASVSKATAEAVGQDVKEQLQSVQVMSQEEVQQLYGRLQKILQAIQANSDYQLAVNGIFQLIDQFKDQVKDLHIDQKLQAETQDKVVNRGTKIWNDIKTIIERFAGEGTLDSFFGNLMAFYNGVADDARARAIFEDGRLLTSRSFANPKIVNDESFKKQFEALFSKSRALTNDPKHNELFNNVLRDASQCIQNIKEDQTTNDLTSAIRRFASDVALDNSGHVSIGTIQDSLVQLKNLLVPVIAKQLEHIPIARIDGSTPKWDFAIEGIVFSAYDVLPDYLKLYFQTQINLDLKQASTDTARAYLRLEVNNIRAHLKNVHFAYRRKVFPTIEDEGWADVDLGGKGLSLRMDWMVATDDRNQTKLSVADVDVAIDDLTISVKKAEHGILDKMAVTLFNGTIKREIEDELQVQLRYFGRFIADNLNDAFGSVARPLSVPVN